MNRIHQQCLPKIQLNSIQTKILSIQSLMLWSKTISHNDDKSQRLALCITALKRRIAGGPAHVVSLSESQHAQA